jgi:hypothetical protein
MAAIKGPMTAAELIARLRADPEWIAADKERKRLHAERIKASRLEEKPLLDDLAAIGVSVESVYRLPVETSHDERIYPVLLDHLTRPYSPMFVEWIGRSFGADSARPFIWNTLVPMLKSRAVEGPAAEGLMAAISEVAKPRDLNALIELITDRSLGVGRIYLVRNLMRSKKPEARATLKRLQNDPDLKKEITARLKASRS